MVRYFLRSQTSKKEEWDKLLGAIQNLIVHKKIGKGIIVDTHHMFSVAQSLKMLSQEAHRQVGWAIQEYPLTIMLDDESDVIVP